MEYKIEISYRTGNSFNTDDCIDLIEYDWTDLDKAKESLKRIENHYKFYEEYSNMYTKPKVKIPIGVVWDTELKQVSLELVDDNGKPFRYSSFWTGYFEELYEAKIKMLDEELRYIP